MRVCESVNELRSRPVVVIVIDDGIEDLIEAGYRVRENRDQE